MSSGARWQTISAHWPLIDFQGSESLAHIRWVGMYTARWPVRSRASVLQKRNRLPIWSFTSWFVPWSLLAWLGLDFLKSWAAGLREDSRSSFGDTPRRVDLNALSKSETHFSMLNNANKLIGLGYEVKNQFSRHDSYFLACIGINFDWSHANAS